MYITANSLINDSIVHCRITHAPNTLELACDLAGECEDHVENGNVTEFWGTTDNGEEWRVHLHGTTVSEAEGVIREIARQDRDGETGGRKRSTAETIDEWHRAAGQAGDLGVCRAIDALSRRRVCEVYDEVNASADEAIDADGIVARSEHSRW